ncbi:ethanolamine utilization protein EutN [Ruminiclostridium sufflavum DSM 19573]|uniref:Ethanolamine utilization protein EutN n=1 Tax=Ruminiclostridium sufflavum DSM 19573 TaxID=1121337 RepID=A0A318XQ86_9FIRM|nr:EutN/CcmL family microcompartment protein [Ruminiclostridium sufflavum]PYG90235.1 ethanolamine utilization protein EutN [Ruminiclostridium sufflavum DSM 19573]
MVIGRVAGNLLATIKKPELEKYKLFVIEPEKAGTHLKNPGYFAAIDLVGAGIGDRVIVLTGSQVQNAVSDKVPADAAIVGIVEAMNIKNKK